MINFLHRLFANIADMPDHDLKINTVTKTSGAWRHEYVCWYCHNPSSHQERMTEICLSCGSQQSFLDFKSAAIRKVTRHGVWVKHQRTNGADYIFNGSEWVTPEEFDAGLEKRQMSEPNYAKEMKLPSGKQCSDCAHFTSCKAMFAAKRTDVYCDFHPSRFQHRKLPS